MSIRDALQHQERIEQALQSHSKDALIRILSDLMKTYVIDGVAPLKPEVGKVHIPVHLRDLSFPVLIETLKFHLDLPDLEKFNVIDGQVYVKLGEREFALDGPAPTAAPRPATPPPPQAASPVPQPPAAATPEPAPVPQRPKAPPAAPKAADDRFRMLELD